MSSGIYKIKNLVNDKVCAGALLEFKDLFKIKQVLLKIGGRGV